MKKILYTLIVTGWIAIILTSCGKSTTSDISPKETNTFGYTCMDADNPFFKVLEATIRDKVEATGDEVVSANPNNDVELQISQIEKMIAQDIDGIFLNPVDAEGILPALLMLKDAGIPIINFDTEVADLSYCDSYVGSDNYNAGYVCGVDLIKKRPEGGDIIILESPATKSATDRVRGFLDAIAGKGFNVVGQGDGKGNTEVSIIVSEDLLQTHKNITAIFGCNDPTALGALAVANAKGIPDCLIYGVDGSPNIKAELIKPNSLIEGTGAQSPVGIAEKSVEVMYKLLAGEEVNEYYPIETFLITSENVNEYGVDSWQ